jgi:hypothetical protein
MVVLPTIFESEPTESQDVERTLALPCSKRAFSFQQDSGRGEGVCEAKRSLLSNELNGLGT